VHVLALALIGVLFGAMAVVFGVQERIEERRILARNEAILARERERGATTLHPVREDERGGARLPKAA
jgi:hypothetical protein